MESWLQLRSDEGRLDVEEARLPTLLYYYEVYDMNGIGKTLVIYKIAKKLGIKIEEYKCPRNVAQLIEEYEYE